jgi:hypothetical protein
MESERGQSAIATGLLLIFVLGIAFFVLSSTLPGMKQGADTIGNAIDEAYEQEMLNLDWQIQNGTVTMAHVNNQRIYANQHSIETHGEQAIAAANCYNDHGVFFIQANNAGDWYFHCLEEDNKTVRTTFWQKIGNQFHMKSAYTKGDGAWSWQQIRRYFETEWGATRATFPPDGVLYIDNVPAPFITP